MERTVTAADIETQMNTFLKTTEMEEDMLARAKKIVASEDAPIEECTALSALVREYRLLLKQSNPSENSNCTTTTTTEEQTA